MAGCYGYFLTAYFQFLSFRRFGHALRILRGELYNPKRPGEVAHLQALATAVSGNVGRGSIDGVASAISMAGLGTTFWRTVACVLGMSTKFVGCSPRITGLKHNADGPIFGALMCYLALGLLAGISLPLPHFLRECDGFQLAFVRRYRMLACQSLDRDGSAGHR